MTRLINADELIKEICKHKGCFATHEGNEPFMAWEVEDYINDAETVDAVPVIRCEGGKMMAKQMQNKGIDYEYILQHWKFNRAQAANDLERYLLRGELPSQGSVARAIVELRCACDCAEAVEEENDKA